MRPSVDHISGSSKVFAQTDDSKERGRAACNTDEELILILILTQRRRQLNRVAHPCEASHHECKHMQIHHYAPFGAPVATRQKIRKMLHACYLARD